MKVKTILALCAVSLMTVSAFAQGTVTFGNNPLRLVKVSYDGAAAVNPTAGDVTVGLYLDGVEVATAPVQATGLFSAGAVAVDGVAAGGTAVLELRAWSAQDVAGQYVSQTLNPMVLGGGTTPPPSIVTQGGMTAMTVLVTTVPEPSTIILGLLGAGVLLLRRRK